MVQVFANFSTRFAGIAARIRPAASFTAPEYSSVITVEFYFGM